MFDTGSKFLIEQYSPDFATWLIGEPISLTELSPSELSLEPIRADALILLQSSNLVLHCEVQTDPDPSLPFRMADYRLRVYRRFPNKRMVQVVIYLRPTNSDLVYQTAFELDTLRCEFQVLRLWEQPTKQFLQLPGLLPYAVLSQTNNPIGILQQVTEQIDTLINRQQQSNLAAATGILAGLVLEKAVIQRLMRRDLMRESVIYQEMREEAREEVREEERQKGERSLILRLLNRKVGAIPDAARVQIENLSTAQLEMLGESLLDFASSSDLAAWLAEQKPS